MTRTILGALLPWAVSTATLLSSAFAQSPVVTGVQPNTTNFIGGLVVTNTNPPPVTQLFDIDVLDPAGLTVTRIECNVNLSAGNVGTLGVYVTGLGGTHVGSQNNASVWTQVSTDTINHTGGRVSFVLSTPFFLAQGQYGMALHYQGANPVYTNPGNQTPPLLPTYSTNEITVDMSAARVRASTAQDPFGGTSNGFSPRHPNLAIHYMSGAVAVDFEGTPTRGASPLPVQFTSFAVSGNQGGILAYAWDFDNDGSVDSTAQNPMHTYTQCGNYTVSLTIVDSMGTYSATKTDYVQTDVVEPDFTTQLIAPNTLQFTDTSSPTPTSWDWDLDGDGTTDSTLQNPTFAYSNACDEVAVTLTASLACQPAATLTRTVAIASALETTFQGGLIISATATGGTNFFDADVANPDGISICGMHIRSNAAMGAPLTVNIWQKPGSYVGAETTPGPWRQVATEQVSAGGPGTRTFVTFSTPIYLAPGMHGIGVQQVGSSPSYTNLGGVQTYTNSDLTITAGSTMGEPLFSGTLFNPRIWNGAVYYSTNSVASAAGYGYIGEGCAGALGVPGNVATSQPTTGGTLTVEIDNLPNNAVLFFLGLSRTNSVFGALPLDLTPFGAPGCTGHVSPDSTLFLLGTNNTAAFNLSIPAGPAFIGTKFFSQGFALDGAANQLGGVMSDAAGFVIGI
ncbi:MAG: PKD domain-containing protein [bacterium]|nr:PKD domain-containing protein [bacterium]